MNIEEMKRIMTLYFQATNEKDGSLIIDYVADEVIWHEGFAGADGFRIQQSAGIIPIEIRNAVFL